MFITGELRSIKGKLGALGPQVDQLLEHRTIQKARAGRPSLTTLGWVFGIVMTGGGVFYTAWTAPERAKREFEDAAIRSTLRLVNDRLRTERELIRVLKPDTPEYRDIPGLE